MIHTTNIVHIGSHRIGKEHPVFIICEGGVTNYGQYEIAKRQIDAAVAAKADAVKFQLWKTELLISRVVAEKYQQKLGYNWFERLKSKELSFADLQRLFAYAKKKGIACFASPHDEDSIDKLVGLRVPCIKIGSGEAHNTRFLAYAASKKLPIIISFGMHEHAEIKKSIQTLLKYGAPSVIPLHCTTEYPTKPAHVALENLRHLMKMVSGPVGYSDHTIGYHIPLAASAIGAKVIEKHITFDKQDRRSLDNPGALLPAEFKDFVGAIRDIESSFQKRIPSAKISLKKSRLWAGQSIVAAKNIQIGEKISKEHLLLKRPLYGGVGPEQLSRIVGRKAKSPIHTDEQVTFKNTL